MSRFFRMRFKFPLSGGEGASRVPRVPCDHCGLLSLPIASRFFVPDDRFVAAAGEAYTLEDVRDQCFFEADGLLLARPAIAHATLATGITGLVPRPAKLNILDQPDLAVDVTWLVVTGRCDTNDVWTRMMSQCPACGMSKEESIVRTTRTTHLLSAPAQDVCRAREAMVGLVVSDRFRQVLSELDFKVDTYIEFEEIPVT